MQWLMAFVGALVGAVVGAGEASLLGLIAGALIGWQGVRIAQLSTRLDAVSHQARIDAAIRHAAEQARSPAQGRAAPPPSDAAAPAPAQYPAQSEVSGPGQNPPERAAPAGSALPERPAAPRHTVPPISTRKAPIDARPAETMRTAHSDPPPRQPHAPSAIERGLAWLRDALFTGNVPVKLGVLVLLFGVAAALKYSVDAGWLHVPLPLRLAMVAAGGLATIVWGWRNRIARPAFGLSLQGGGIGVLLLTIFAAYRLYQLLPAGFAFGCVVTLVAGAATLAVLQNAVALALLGFLGGYLAPVLLSSGGGHPVPLFSFYALLNLAVFAIAWWRHWRALNLLGFLFTFAIGLSWGARYYRAELFTSVEPFLVLFFVFYVAIVVLHALRPGPGRQGFVDGTLLFGTPLLAFPMQAAMLHAQPMALAYSALAMAVLYAVLAWTLIRRARLLGQAFAALATGFATLAVPLAFSSRWTCAAWALEGVALVWLGLRQQRLLPQVSGLALQLLAAAAYGVGLIENLGWDGPAGEWPLLNGHALCVLLLAAAGFAISRLYERAGHGRGWVWPPFMLGCAWWWWAGLREVEHHGRTTFGSITLDWNATLLLWAALTLAVMASLRRALHWPRLGWPVVGTLLLGVPLALLTDIAGDSALRGAHALAWVVWVAAAMSSLALLRQSPQRGLWLGHVAVLATLALTYGLALANVEASLGEDWRFALGLAPLLGLVVLTARWPSIGAFPLADRFAPYAMRWFIPAGVVLGLAWLASLALPGDTAPLPYLPLLNPTELLQLAALLAAARWLRGRGPHPAAVPLALAGYATLSMAGLRAVHHYAQLPWSPSLLDHGVTQSTLTILWALTGVAAWVLGSRRQHWGLWLIGAITMSVVLAKLVLVDRLYVGNLAGIVSFIAVGGLLVLVGRIAPTPPRHDPLRSPD